MTLKKRITIVTGPMAGHGGEETVIVNFINNLANQFDFELFVSQVIGDDSWLKQLNDHTRITIGTTSTNRLMKAGQLLNYMRTCNSDAVIVFTPRLLFLVDFVRKIMLKKYRVISWVQFSIAHYFSKRDQKYLKHADEHLAISTGIQKQLVQIGVEEHKIHLIYNPVSKSRQVISPSLNQTNFLYVARIQFNQEKNMQALFDACKRLEGSWHLDVYGTDSTSTQVEYQKCIDYTNHLGISANITWHGWVAEVWQQVEYADALVLSSVSEGFGMVLAEAASRGIPLISFDCPVGPADIISHDNGFLIENNNVDQFAKAMQGFVDKQFHFSEQKVKRSIANLYDDVYYYRVAKVLSNLFWE